MDLKQFIEKYMTGMSPAAISNGVNLGVGMERNRKRFIKIEVDDDDS